MGVSQFFKHEGELVSVRHDKFDKVFIFSSATFNQKLTEP